MTFMRTLSGVHFGSYWMGENDVVCLMARDLASLCDLTVIDTDIYGDAPSGWYVEDKRWNAKNPLRWLDHNRVMSTVDEGRAEFVIVNSGGMSLAERTIRSLRDRGVVTVGISLSDPDVFPYHGRVYWHWYDLYYTNAIYSQEHQYVGPKRVRLLPFAASERVHRPMPEVEKIYDLVVVGHARPDRLKVVKRLKKVCSVGLFGSGWGAPWRPVHGEEHVRALNQGRMYLSFAPTAAGYVNVKVGLFEAAATRTVLVTDRFAEMERYFRYGLEVLGHRGPGDLVDLVRYYRQNDIVRQWIAENSYRRCLSEHTWSRRWEGVLAEIRRLKQEPR